VKFLYRKHSSYEKCRKNEMVYLKNKILFFSFMYSDANLDFITKQVLPTCFEMLQCYMVRPVGMKLIILVQVNDPFLYII
jgi:hypothetical protein